MTLVHKSTMNDAGENKRRDLWRALQTCVLTHEELLEVANYGVRINVELMISYNADEKLQEFSNALLM